MISVYSGRHSEIPIKVFDTCRTRGIQTMLFMGCFVLCAINLLVSYT